MAGCRRRIEFGGGQGDKAGIIIREVDLLSDFGKRWIVHDRSGNLIYLTQERWKHIADENNHPEMLDYEDYLQQTLKKGRRRQEPLNP